MRANLCRSRDASFAILFNFCGQFHNARRFGGLHRKTLSPFPTACNETQRPPKPSPFQCPALMANIHLLTALNSAVFCFGQVDSYPTLTPFAVLRELRTRSDNGKTAIPSKAVR